MNATQLNTSEKASLCVACMDVKEASFEQFAEKIERVVENVFNAAKEINLTCRRRKAIILAVQTISEITISRLFRYAVKKEGPGSLLDAKVRDGVVEYLKMIKTIPSAGVPMTELVELTVEYIVEIFSESSKENNGIDWGLVDRVIYAFDRVQGLPGNLNIVPSKG